MVQLTKIIVGIFTSIIQITVMEIFDIQQLNERLPEIKASFQAKKPFRYVAIDNFLPEAIANQIHDNYPAVNFGEWDGTTYLDQKNKFQKSKFEEGSFMQEVFDQLNGPVFCDWLDRLVELEEPLMGDADLFGGGLHQSINGAFLNVHVDYNIHPKTQYHRRLNAIIYLNKDWKDSYQGHNELWDFTDGKKVMLDRVAPIFNRCVIFETNEISFHGHPTPLNTPEGVTRKSLATYYYTKDRPEHEKAADHNTIYINTEGSFGQWKRFVAGVKAFAERTFKK
jgi:Rps23 Pro-64 3,4-dihydroxylase Tpa1-like proline 4-hydroxylase